MERVSRRFLLREELRERRAQGEKCTGDPWNEGYSGCHSEAIINFTPLCSVPISVRRGRALGARRNNGGRQFHNISRFAGVIAHSTFATDVRTPQKRKSTQMSIESTCRASFGAPIFKKAMGNGLRGGTVTGCCSMGIYCSIGALLPLNLELAL